VPLRDELDAAIARVLDSKHFILGPEVEAFESELATYLGARHAIGVANGTEALTIALRALGVGPGDDVVVTSFTFYASAEAIPPAAPARSAPLRRSASTRPRTSVRSATAGPC